MSLWQEAALPLFADGVATVKVKFVRTLYDDDDLFFLWYFPSNPKKP
jgi:hypothetical protein